jgi:hypothetical protein
MECIRAQYKRKCEICKKEIEEAEYVFRDEKKYRKGICLKCYKYMLEGLRYE